MLKERNTNELRWQRDREAMKKFFLFFWSKNSQSLESSTSRENGSDCRSSSPAQECVEMVQFVHLY